MANAWDKQIALLLLAIAGLWAFLTFEVVPGSTTPGSPGPRFFPYLLSVCLAVMACWLFVADFVQARLRPRLGWQAPSGEAGAQTATASSEEMSEGKAVLLSFGLLVGYIVVIGQLGFLLTTPVALLVAVRGLMGEKSWPLSIAISLAITGSVYVVFRLMLGAYLPEGNLF